MDPHAIRQLQVKVPQGREEFLCQRLSLFVAEQVGPSDGVGKESVAAENREGGILPIAFGGQERHVFWGVPGRMLRCEDHPAQIDRVSVPELVSIESVRGSALDREDGLGRSGAVDQFTRPGHEVGVNMRFEDVRDRELILACQIHVHVNISPRVDDGGLAGRLVTDQIREVCHPFRKYGFTNHR
jgi:hypothetical protein